MLEHGQLAGAADRQREFARGQQGGQGEGEARVGRAGRAHPGHRTAAVQGLVETGCTREQRRGVAVVAHAEHGHVHRPGLGGQAAVGGVHQTDQGGLVQRVRQRVEERHKGGCCGLVFQQVLAHQRGVAVGVVVWHAALVDQQHGHARPLERQHAQRFKQRNGRLAARDREHRVAALVDRGVQALCDGVGELPGQFSGRVAGVLFHDSSTQAEFSRAMRADEAAGPQLPAV